MPGIDYRQARAQLSLPAVAQAQVVIDQAAVWIRLADKMS
jgi:hypothetical protein